VCDPLCSFQRNWLRKCTHSRYFLSACGLRLLWQLSLWRLVPFHEKSDFFRKGCFDCLWMQYKEITWNWSQSCYHRKNCPFYINKYLLSTVAMKVQN
jgi:hypothetical protein